MFSAGREPFPQIIKSPPRGPYRWVPLSLGTGWEAGLLAAAFLRGSWPHVGPVAVLGNVVKGGLRLQVESRVLTS